MVTRGWGGGGEKKVCLRVQSFSTARCKSSDLFNNNVNIPNTTKLYS